MLPARSTRYAGLDGEIPRIHLVSNVQLALIAVIMLALFWLLFSPNSLVGRLYAQDRYDGLTWSYLQNLYHSNPHNADVAILLARVQQETTSTAELEEHLFEFADSPDQRQRDEVRLILLKAYQRELRGTVDAQRKATIQLHMRQLVQGAANETISDVRVARLLAFAALSVGLTPMGIHYLQLAAPDADPADTLVDFARQARDSGEYETAANCFFAARALARSPDQARKRFQLGINALMANAEFDRAMQAAEQEIGDLRNDPPTLRYLIRQARAAGHPDLAARYAWSLITRHPAESPA